MANDRNRLKAFRFSGGLLPLYGTGTMHKKTRIIDGFPPDATLIQARLSDCMCGGHRDVILTVHSTEFPALANGEIIPNANIKCETVE